MKPHFRVVLTILVVVCVVVLPVENAYAAVTITGVTSSKYLVTGSPVNVSADAVFKITFEDKTAGTNVELCAGAITDFVSGACPLHLSGSGGPGFVFLTIVDATALKGKVIYVIRVVGTVPAAFALTIE